MKTLKLVLSLLFVCVANIALATDATVTYPSLSYNNTSGTALIIVGGSNGNWMLSNTSSQGSLASLSDVQRANQVVMVAQPAGGDFVRATQCYLTLPQGVTATVSYSVVANTSSVLGGVYATIDSTTITSAPGTTTQGTVTLSAGTHFIKAHGYNTYGGSVVQIVVGITYP